MSRQALINAGIIRETANAEDSTARSSATDESLELTGTVRWFNIKKRFGFIAPDGEYPDVFLHGTRLREADCRVITEGCRIGFVAVHGARGLCVAKVLWVDLSTGLDPEQRKPRTHVHVEPTSDWVQAYVVRYNWDRGMIFLSVGPGTPDIFLHVETLLHWGVTSRIREGLWLDVRWGEGPKGRMAVHVRPSSKKAGR